MVRPLASAVILVVVLIGGLRVHAQSTARIEFDVVSIKRNVSAAPTAGVRTSPDGSATYTNQSIRSIIMRASPVPVREVAGLPDWVNSEHYDIAVRPPAGATREQLAEMWRTMFADRMKLAAHVEQQERDTFALVLARSDGRLGDAIKPSTTDCGRRAQGPPPPVPPSGLPEAVTPCGIRVSGTSMSGFSNMNALAQILTPAAGRLVNNRTGFDGAFTFTLTFARTPGLTPPSANAPPDDAPDLFTALQEQLGLKLQPEKSMVPVLVIDHMERPTEN